MSVWNVSADTKVHITDDDDDDDGDDEDITWVT